jgi:hypothetical protein
LLGKKTDKKMPLEIGQVVTVTPVASTGGTKWTARCNLLPDDWSCELVRRSTANLVVGQPLMSWVFDMDRDRHHVQVSDSNFGFLPVSDRMRPRYLASLRDVVALLRCEGQLSAEASTAVSEVKGMFSRCARRDQWDWHTVESALGNPGRAAAADIAKALAQAGSAIRAGDVGSARRCIQALSSPDLVRTLETAATTIGAATPRIPRSRALSPRKPTGEKPAASGVVVSTYVKQKLDTAIATHAELLSVLSDQLGAHGHLVEANQYIDAFTRLKSGPAIFEAKSISDDNELHQVRQGVSQLYEYRFRHGLADASLWLLLSRSPKEKWLVDYLETDRGIHLLWLEDGEIRGPSIGRLLQSGSQAASERGQAR